MPTRENSKATFQSTHPVRGATKHDAPHAVLLRISIHAPRAGCDDIEAPLIVKSFKFQSTHPVRGATRTVCANLIHTHHFNPRTPCGVRLQRVLDDRYVKQNFNPRTPCGVRPYIRAKLYKRQPISIHAPRAGCDLEASRKLAAKKLFQSTHPVRGATANMYNLVCSYFCNFTKSDVCLLTLYLFYHAISTENVVFSRFSAVRSAPGIHVRSRLAPRQSISSPSGA